MSDHRCDCGSLRYRCDCGLLRCQCDCELLRYQCDDVLLRYQCDCGRSATNVIAVGSIVFVTTIAKALSKEMD